MKSNKGFGCLKCNMTFRDPRKGILHFNYNQLSLPIVSYKRLSNLNNAETKSFDTFIKNKNFQTSQIIPTSFKLKFFLYLHCVRHNNDDTTQLSGISHLYSNVN